MSCIARRKVVRIEGLLDDPDALKKVDAMAEGPDKEAARAALPDFAPEERAGDAHRDFERISELIDATKASDVSSMGI